MATAAGRAECSALHVHCVCVGLGQSMVNPALEILCADGAAKLYVIAITYILYLYQPMCRGLSISKIIMWLPKYSSLIL